MDMAASSSSSAAAPADADDTKTNDVFLSFRGEDTRRTFTSHLHAALLEKKITTYIDDKLKRGDEIAAALLEAIEESLLSVIIFSQNYASSTWCLDELVHILKCNKREGQMVIPVFYDINPSDVRKQRGNYADAFAQLEQRFENSLDKVQKWRVALTNAANISGFDSKNYGTDADLVKKVVEDISTKLCHKSSCDLEGLVGIESHIEQIESLLGIHSQDACITVGIWGMGGLGKTTLADAVFRKLSSEFEACCFLRNVREREQKDGLEHLQKKLLSEILREEGLSIGSTFVRERLSRTKVLIVLDDVSDSMQMERLVGERLRYGTGSRIIITSRDRRTLRQTVEEGKIHKVGGLKPDDALQLFCSRAFKNNRNPRTDYKELAKKAVAYAGGVPLALILLGSSFLNCKSKEDWEDDLNKLKEFPNENILRVLRISYDGLGRNEKEIFLDIACFHKGEFVNEVKKMLAIRGRFAAAGIRVLVDTSLISIHSRWDKPGTIEMHDLLQELGRTIVQKQCIEDPGKRDRLFTNDDVNRVLKNNTVTPNVQAIMVYWYMSEEGPLNCADFKKMSNLRLLIVKYCQFGRKFTASLDLPDSLRYIYWPRYPLKSLPSNFSLENLVELHMPYSNVEKLWKEDKRLVNLEVIDLHDSEYLTEVPNLSGSLKIVNINLNGCFRLVEIPWNFQHLDKLTHLDLGACASLKYLPEMPGNIKYLDLRYSGMKELPESVWSNEKISYLNISGCEDLEKLPSNRCKLKVSGSFKLEYFTSLSEFSELPMDISKLSLEGCTTLVSLPTNICKLKFLKRLTLKGCSKLENFPEILEPMEHLVSLSLKGTAVGMLPSSIGNLIRLQTLNLSRCRNLKVVPMSIYSLTNLLYLNFYACQELKKLPSSFVGFVSLQVLNLSYSGILEILDGLVCSTSLQYLSLSGTKIRSIPASIKQASRLSELHIVGCKRLQSLPELPVLCNVKAQGCTLLKTVLSSRTALTQGWVKRDKFYKLFTNCPKLDNNARSNIMDEAHIRIMGAATTVPLESHCWPLVRTVCPGKEIPNWFSFQSEGSAVNIKLRPDWYPTGLLGFALSAIVSGVSKPQCDLRRVRANLIVKFMSESHELFTSEIFIPSSGHEHHVYVWNEAFGGEKVAKICSPDVCKLANEASVDFCLVVSGRPTSASHMKVESCGICPLYAEDAKKFKFDHVFMSREPKVEEETRQDDDSNVVDQEMSLKPVDQVLSLKQMKVMIMSQKPVDQVMSPKQMKVMIMGQKRVDQAMSPKQMKVTIMGLKPVKLKMIRYRTFNPKT